jgi:hypothetical protein
VVVDLLLYLLAIPPVLRFRGEVRAAIRNAIASRRQRREPRSACSTTIATARRAADDLLKLLAVKPQWIAHDLHPTYVSTMSAAQFARELHVPHVRLQHHYAHAAAVLAEHGQMVPALAVVCDGTGYGTDHTIWGGELLTVDFKGFRRLGHLKPLRPRRFWRRRPSR